MKLGVIGAGVVGKATARAFLEHVDEVRVHDCDSSRATHNLLDVLASDLVFVCLPTPQKADGLACDTSVLDDFWYTVMDRDVCFVLRSTVPIGYTRQARARWGLPGIVHSPEFLTARTALVDAQMPAVSIVGGGDGERTYCEQALEALYRERWPHVPVHLMTSDESEAVKLYTNGFGAIKVAAFNELEHDAAKRGLNWQAVRGAMLARGTIHPLHTVVPGHDGYGFSGACLPKDLANLIECQREAGCTPYMTLAAHMRNVEDRKRTK